MKALDNKVRAQRIYKNHMKKILLSNNDKHDPSKKSSSILSKKAHELLKPGSRIEVHPERFPGADPETRFHI